MDADRYLDLPLSRRLENQWHLQSCTSIGCSVPLHERIWTLELLPQKGGLRIQSSCQYSNQDQSSHSCPLLFDGYGLSIVLLFPAGNPL